MPVVIATPEGQMPAIVSNETDEAVLKDLAALDYIPPEALTSAAAMRDWLQTLPPPSGWFETEEEAADHQQRVHRELDSQLIRDVLAERMLSQSALSAAIGLADPGRDGSPVRKIQLAKTAMSGPTRRALAYMLKYGPMSRDEERKILGDVKGGGWRKVKRSSIRRA